MTLLLSKTFHQSKAGVKAKSFQLNKRYVKKVKDSSFQDGWLWLLQKIQFKYFRLKTDGWQWKSPHYSLLKIDLITGRKHQIRRHAKLAGHPVTGDNRYGSKRSVAFLKNRCSYHRLGLHCQSIEFKAPGSNNNEQHIRIQSKNTLEEMMIMMIMLKMDK